MRLKIYDYIFFSGILITLFLNYLPLLLRFLFLIILIFFRWITYKSESIEKRLLFLSIDSVPISFISILGNSTAEFPISWFHIFILSLSLIIILKSKFRRSYLILFLLFLLYGFITLFWTHEILEAVKQLFVIIIFLLSFFISDYALVITNQTDFQKLCGSYFLGTVSVAAQVIVQEFTFRTFNLSIGYSTLLGYSRMAFGAMMADFSFTSVYIFSGFLLFIILFLKYKISMYKIICFSIILCLGGLYTTARTGIYSLGLIFILFSILNIFNFNLKKIAIQFLSLISLYPIYIILIEKRGIGNLFDSSGRLSNYIESFNIVSNRIDYLLLGIGLGTSQLSFVGIDHIPHNFLIQYIVQIGFIGLGIILVFLMSYLYHNFIKGNMFIWLIVYVFIASLFIPDIFASRFLYALIVINSVSIKLNITEL